MSDTSTRPLALDEARLAGWVRDHGRAVRGYVLGLVGRDDVADDLVQEVYRRAWQARDRYHERGSPRAYLLRIADRLVCDHGRRAGREVTLDDARWQEVQPSDGQREPSAGLLRSEARQALDRALAMLTPPQRRVLLMRYYGDLSFAEIAESLDAPLGTVLSHCRRALLALRKILVEDPS
jgi:RNA polymerase sigma-70 factor (ECF subfamily)